MSREKIQGLTIGKPIRFTKPFWAKIEKLSKFYGMPMTSFLRMRVEEHVGPVLEDELKKIKERRAK